MVERHATLEQRLDFLEQAIGLDLKDKPTYKKLEKVIPRCSMLVRISLPTISPPSKSGHFKHLGFFNHPYTYGSIWDSETKMTYIYTHDFFGINSENPMGK